MPKIPDGLTIKITYNSRENTTRILSYRKGDKLKRSYKAILPVCSHTSCKKRGYKDGMDSIRYDTCRAQHQKFVDVLVKKLIASYR